MRNFKFIIPYTIQELSDKSDMPIELEANAKNGICIYISANTLSDAKARLTHNMGKILKMFND
jgi:hypothetical protein